jgi:hypothetical protein
MPTAVQASRTGLPDWLDAVPLLSAAELAVAATLAICTGIVASCGR